MEPVAAEEPAVAPEPVMEPVGGDGLRDDGGPADDDDDDISGGDWQTWSGGAVKPQ
jgi:hypothetical protein